MPPGNSGCFFARNQSVQVERASRYFVKEAKRVGAEGVLIYVPGDEYLKTGRLGLEPDVVLRASAFAYNQGASFLAEVEKAESTAGELHARLKEFGINPASGLNAAQAAFQNLTKNCAACHKTYRN